MSNDIQVSILASGSTGNATYIETPQRKILVDAGFSGKKIKEMLEKIDRRIEDIDSLFITHEHSDHIKGVGVLARKYDLNVYANQKTWDALPHSCGEIPLEKKNVFEPGNILTLGDIDVESFSVSHDAANPQFYSFQKNQKSFVILTDTGYVNDKMKRTIENADVYLMESNHDVEMLRMGGYPWRIKQRILSDKGHLSNEDSGIVMTELIGDKTKRIYLGHLSQENNLVELANMTMTSTLMQNDLGVNEKFTIHDTSFSEPTKLFSI
ncbi:MAG: MBL fold metallo-hydrolase [Streptococcaceae bacterium]|jgi:ribonuclease Z|nr:MBL fold metallo-hydrolase [Streptococcaceae bacterium]